MAFRDCLRKAALDALATEIANETSFKTLLKVDQSDDALYIIF